MKVISEMRRAH